MDGLFLHVLFFFQSLTLAIFVTTNKEWSPEKLQSYGRYSKFNKSVLYGVLQKALWLPQAQLSLSAAVLEC